MQHVSKTKTAGDSGGIVEGEEFDFAYDCRLARRWKRRRIASEKLRLNKCSNKASKGTVNGIKKNNKNNGVLVEVITVDSDYEELLDNVVQYVDVGNNTWCVDNDDDQFLDPEYMIFLNNLKEEGKSYVLEITSSNETSFVVRYEEDNGSSNGLDGENLEEFQSKENTETENSWRSQLNGEKTENPIRVLRSKSGRNKVETRRSVSEINSGRQKAESPKTVLRHNSKWRKIESSRKILRSTSRREGKRRHGILNDAVERGKTENPRILRGNERTEENGSVSLLNDVVKREKTESPRTLKSNSRRENNKSLSILQSLGNKEKAENPRTLQNVLRSERMGTPKRLRDAQTTDKMNLKVEKKIKMEEYHVSTNSCSSERHGLDVNVQYKCNFGMDSSFVDESYLEFLNSLEKNGQNLLFAHECGSRMIYDKDDDSSSDSEVMILDRDAFLVGNLTPFESSRSDGSCVIVDGGGFTESPCGSKEPKFRETLMEILQKPFNMKEFEALWRDASQQRPKEGKRELRQRTVTFLVDSDDFIGKSYLDQHKGLAKKIDEARRDRRKILNLLRGFFYWLENVSHEGAFTPWSDAQCLSTLPPV